VRLVRRSDTTEMHPDLERDWHALLQRLDSTGDKYGAILTEALRNWFRADA